MASLTWCVFDRHTASLYCYLAHSMGLSRGFIVVFVKRGGQKATEVSGKFNQCTPTSPRTQKQLAPSKFLLWPVFTLWHIQHVFLLFGFQHPLVTNIDGKWSLTQTWEQTEQGALRSKHFLVSSHPEFPLLCNWVFIRKRRTQRNFRVFSLPWRGVLLIVISCFCCLFFFCTVLFVNAVSTINFRLSKESEGNVARTFFCSLEVLWLRMSNSTEYSKTKIVSIVNCVLNKKKHLKHTKMRCNTHKLELALSKSTEFIDKSEVKTEYFGSLAIFTVKGGKQFRSKLLWHEVKG